MTPRSRDIGEYLGLVGPWAWMLFALYSVVYVLIAIVEGLPHAGVAVTAGSLLCVLTAALLIASPSPTPLPPVRLVPIALLCVATVVIMFAELPVDIDSQPLESWQLGAVNFVLFVLELRGRIVSAWVLMAVVVAIGAGWSVLHTGDPWLGLKVTYGQAVSLAAGTIFAIGLQRTARQIFAQQDAERARAAEEAALSAGDAHRAAELAEVRALAEPLLQRIADGERPDRREAVTLEAALRDRIRGRALAIEPLTGALRRARERGADVLLLDDLGDAVLPEERAQEVAAWCATRLDAITGPRATIRIAAAEGAALVSIADADGMVGEETVPLQTEAGSAFAARPPHLGSEGS